MVPKKQLYQFKITLKETKPPIWRKIQVPSSYTFWDLHVAIQDVMGWQDYHLHEFQIKDLNGTKVFVGIPTDDDMMADFMEDHKVLPGWKHKLSKFLSITEPSFLYVYDFGDDWQHTIKLEKVLPAEEGVTYPRCIGGKRNSPPEDCGGPWGYENLLEVLSDPGNAEYEEMKEWADSMKGGPFDPEAFNPNRVLFENPRERFEIAFSQG